MDKRERPQSMKSFVSPSNSNQKKHTMEEALKNKEDKITQPVDIIHPL